MGAAVTTVRGQLPSSELGVTLMHEHLIANWLREYRKEGLLNDLPLMMHELQLLRAAGGNSLVELTTSGAGREPSALLALSEASGINIIATTGFYRHQYLDTDWLDRTETNDLARWVAREIEEGIDGTGIRAGIIKVASERWMTAHEERAFRAAARAHRKTGVTISTHAARWPVGLRQLDLLQEERVDPHRVVIGHCDAVSSPDWTSRDHVFEYHEAIAARGAYVQFDTIAHDPSEYFQRTRADYVLNLINKGYIDQILLSQDIGITSRLSSFGGLGYGHLLTAFVPRLQSRGVSAEAVTRILVDNPRRALTGV